MSIWLQRATGINRDIDFVEVRRALAIFADPEHGCEIRGLPSGRSVVRKGDDLDALIEGVQALATDQGIYYALNPIDANLQHASRVADVLCRRWLLVDVDPVKPASDKDNSATQEEKDKAGEIADAIAVKLKEDGWPSPVVVDSGNGWHLLYRIDLPNDEESRTLLKAVLYKLGDTYDTQWATVDRSVHNASRISKLPGTWAQKGNSTTERPHRRACLVMVPEPIEIVPVAMLRELVGIVDEPGNGHANGQPFVVKAASTTASYGQRALELEVARVCMAPNGKRNTYLNTAAFSLGQLVAGGELNENQVIDALHNAAIGCGLDVDKNCGLEGIRKTVQSGMNAGAKKPRKAPERPSDKPQWEKVTKAKEQNVIQRPVIHSMPELMAMDIPEPKWAVPGLMSEGLSILAGKPKLGKSWMALNLALTIAAGGTALGHVRVQPGEVLYLSLEDRLRRLQNRTTKLLRGLDVSVCGNLQCSVQWPKQNVGGLFFLKEWLDNARNPRLIIIDVWAKFRSPFRQGPQYDQDYEFANQVKELADEYACSLLILHHCKKAAAEDVVDEISGTLGLAGAADGLLILTRARGENEGDLFVTGRDVDEQTLALEFNKDNFAWKCVGKAEERTNNKMKNALINVFKANAGATISTSELKTRLMLKDEQVGNMRSTLYKMTDEGMIATVGAGKFRWPVQGDELFNGV